MSRYFQQTEERLNELDDEASMHALYQLNIGSSVINAQDTIASERAIIVEELLSVLRENHVEPQVNS